LVLRSQSAHPLDPLGPTEIAVAIATVRAAGATPEVRPPQMNSHLSRLVLVPTQCRMENLPMYVAREPRQKGSFFSGYFFL